MRVLVIVPDYPNKDKISYQFVHERVKKYLEFFAVDVFILNNKKTDYVYESVNVICGNKKRLESLVSKYDKFAFHFLDMKSANFILKKLRNKEIYIWFHGTDSVSYKRRLGRINYSRNKLFNPIMLFKFIAFIFLYKIRAFNIRKINRKCNVTFVFVSNWNKEISELDLKIKYKKYRVIPNCIDFDIFKYIKKTSDQRFKVLSINNYANNIYAGDMIQDIILAFSKEKEFSDFEFQIYGKGKLFNKYTEKNKNFKNVKIKNMTLSHNEIAEIQKKYGIFLYPKRGDSQGVSRCEAMASGLVSIASNIEAIPEFSPDNTTYLVNTIDEFVETLKFIHSNPDDFMNKSVASSKFVKEKCSYENTIKKEIDLLGD